MRTIGIYPGNFQPPHIGHKKSYEKLKQYAVSDTFVITTDYDPSVDAPLHFGDKEQILVRHGIPGSHIRKVKNLNNPVEVLENFDPETTVVIYGLGKKDASAKLTASNYYKLLSSVGSNLLPYKSQSYIVIVNDDITIRDREGKARVYTSKNIREALGSQRFTKKQKEAWFKEFFGWFDLGLFELLKNKYESAYQSDVFEKPSTTEIPPEDVKEILSREIINILNEYMSSPPSIATDTESNDGDVDFGMDALKTDAEKRKEDAQKRTDLTQQKKQAEDEKKMHFRQAQRDKSSYHNYDKYTKRQDDQKLASINKQLTQRP